MDPLTIYLSQLTAPLLTWDEEVELSKRIQNGDCEARETLIKANLRLVVNIAKRYHRHKNKIDNLIANGNLGLIRAVECFKYEFRARFATYASWWIHQSIKRGLHENNLISIPQYLIELTNRWKTVEAELSKNDGKPTIQEIAAKCGITEKQTKYIQLAHKIENEASYSDDTNGIKDSASYTNTEPIYEYDELYLLHEKMKLLSPREYEIISLRFGLNENEPHTLEQISIKIGANGNKLTRERIRQIEAQAINKLRYWLVR